MCSETSVILMQRLRKVFLLVLLTSVVGCGCAKSSCTKRRCLAEMLISKNYSSQPQNENCTQNIYVPLIEYQTLSVDTKTLHLYSRLTATIIWRDPALKWNTSIYKHDQVVLPVSKVWTPEIRVTNGIVTTMEHGCSDLLVYSNGTLRHSVIINAEINCEVNMFNYPFAADECPVAIQTWTMEGCGSDLVLGRVKVIDSSHGDWETDRVSLQKQRHDRNYIMVSLRIKHTNPVITLLLPSILIILADVVSFALPLGGGERNSFKVTLVLSFTMFLGILNDKLPGDSQCSPVIRTHFCICQVLLVSSMLVSLVLTRVAKEGKIVFGCTSKPSDAKAAAQEEDRNDEEAKGDISIVQLDRLKEETKVLRQVLNILQAFEAKEVESERFQRIANIIDKSFFWLYSVLGAGYFCAITYVMMEYQCKVNHFDFWD